jgi:hypothetical protein
MRKPSTIIAPAIAAALVLSCSAAFQAQSAATSPAASASRGKTTSVGIKLSPFNPALSSIIASNSSKAKAAGAAKSLGPKSPVSPTAPRTPAVAKRPALSQAVLSAAVARSVASAKAASKASGAARAFMGVSSAQLQIFAAGDTALATPLETWSVNLATDIFDINNSDEVIITQIDVDHELPDALTPDGDGNIDGQLFVVLFNANNASGLQETASGIVSFSLPQGSTPETDDPNNLLVTCFPTTAAHLATDGTKSINYTLPTPWQMNTDDNGFEGVVSIGSEQWFQFTATSSTGYTKLTATPSAGGTEEMLLLVFNGENGTWTDGTKLSIVGLNGRLGPAIAAPAIVVPAENGGIRPSSSTSITRSLSRAVVAPASMYPSSMIIPTVQGQQYYCVAVEAEMNPANPVNTGFSIACADASDPTAPAGANVNVLTASGTLVESGPFSESPAYFQSGYLPAGYSALWYSFQGIAGTIYTIETYPIEGMEPSAFIDVDTVIKLFAQGDDYSGDPLVSNDDSNSIIENGNFSTISEWTCPTTGIYYVEVLGYDPTISGPFNVTVYTTSTPVSPPED